MRRDNWIPGFSHFKLYSDNNILDQLIKVEDLIDRYSHTLNKLILNTFCLPFDRDRILNIPLPPIFNKDKRAWLPAQDGEFSVKRAY